MGIQHEEQAPRSFADSFTAGFLGDPGVVSGLVGKFAASVESLLSGGASSKEDFVAKANGLVRAYADIFAGRVGAYKTIPGFHSVSLPAKLRADLGEFYGAHRSKWGDDPLCVFFEWLFVHVTEAVKRADGDEMLLEVMLKPTLQQANRHLMGTEERAA